MANAINSFSGSGTTSVGTGRTTQVREPAAAPTTAPPQSQGQDQVQITGTASQLASMGQKLSALPAMDPALVARISRSVADGTYKISADKIASGLLQSEHALAQIGM